MLDAEKETLDRLNNDAKEIKSILNHLPNPTLSRMTNKSNNKLAPKTFFIEALDQESAQAKINAAFENLRVEYDLVVPFHNPIKSKNDDKYLKTISKHGAKIRILVIADKTESNNRFIDLMKKGMPCTDNCELRTLEIEDKLHFAIIDSSEAWFRLASVDENPENTSVLVTDSKELVTIAKHEFEALWNSSKAEVLLSKRTNN